ncbi:MAG: methionyl-tRNA formyltransferase [Bacteroidota bacterium]
MKIGLLVSGSLGCSLLKELSHNNEILAVLTNKSSEGIIEFCQTKMIPYYVGNPRNGRVREFIKIGIPDLLLSVNYLFLIEEDLIQWPKLWAFNVHGSLLPKYRGRTPHVWSIINNEFETGVTVHLIDESCDTGDIVAQERVAIETDDTGASLLSKYVEIYPKIIDRVLKMIQLDEIVPRRQEESKATIFGKRTPDDGLIDWNWQKERIRNWVRAQSFPYPGAFSFYKGHKLIIDKVEYSDNGFRSDQTNGTILEVKQGLIVKCPNGSLRLSAIRNELPKISPGEILN